jgi:hypothetical protein
MLPGNSFQADSVREILFTFCDGQLYRMSATYGRSAIEGLKTEDLVQSIAAKYGPPIKPPTETDVSKAGPQGPEEKVVALWGDAQYSLSLNRSYLASVFTLVMYSLQANAAADAAIAKAIKKRKRRASRGASEESAKFSTVVMA